MEYTSRNLLIHPTPSDGTASTVVNVTPEIAGWNFISFQVRHLREGEPWRFSSNEREMAIVNLSGRYDVDTNFGRWDSFGGRSSVFSGPGELVYLPRHAEGSLTAKASGEVAVAWATTEEDHAPFYRSAEEIQSCIRGGDTATRQINLLLPPDFPVQRLVLVEVYTPPGSWSSYPPHKHDIHRVNNAGQVVEADLEEIYYFRFDKPEGYALQQVYTDSTSPLHQAGQPIDAVLRVGDNDVVVVPEGYHPVCSPPGYWTYYLNVLAGSAQSLANTEDPRYAWVKESYSSTDGRLPLYPLHTKLRYER